MKPHPALAALPGLIAGWLAVTPLLGGGPDPSEAPPLPAEVSLHPSPEPRLAPRPRAHPVPAAQPPPTTDEDQAQDPELRQERARFLTRWGRPPRPPSPLPPAFDEMQIEQTLHALVESHGGELISLDCNVYPCSAILLQSAESVLNGDHLARAGYPNARASSGSATADNEWFSVEVSFLAEPVSDREMQFVWRNHLRVESASRAAFQDALGDVRASSVEDPHAEATP